MAKVLQGAMVAFVIAVGVFGGLKAYEKWGDKVSPTVVPNP